MEREYRSVTDIAQASTQQWVRPTPVGQETRFAQAIIAPAAVIVIVVMILPIFANIYISFYSIPWGED